MSEPIFEATMSGPNLGQEIQIQTDSRAQFFSDMRDLGVPIYDPRKMVAFYDWLNTQKKPAGAPPSPHPVPQQKPVQPAPVESLPILPVVNDAPELQGAPDVATEVSVTIERPSGPMEPQEAPEWYWVGNSDSPTPPDADALAAQTTPAPADNEAFEDYVKRILRNQPEPGEPDPSHAAQAPTARTTDADPVELFSGAFTTSQIDLVVPSAILPISFRRSYRSGRPYFGPFGFGWDHNFNIYLRPLNSGDIAVWTGELLEQQYRQTSTGWQSSLGVGARIELLPGIGNGYLLTFPDGRQWEFGQPAAWNNAIVFPLRFIRDRHKNQLSLAYDSNDRLQSVVDEVGCGLFFTYGACGLLESLRDHTGTRQVSFWHDAEVEHLVRVTLPATAQYPDGILKTYEYDRFAEHPAMQHNILRIRDAQDQLMVENEYAGPDADWQFNTVVRQRFGSFEFAFEYEQIQYVFPDPEYIDALASRTLVRTPDGALHTYTFNYRGDLLDHRFRLILDGSLRIVATQWQYDAYGNLIKQTMPDGIQTIYRYDSSNADSAARRNLLEVKTVIGLPGIVPERTLFRATYETQYQLPLWTMDEQGAETRFFYDFDDTPVGSSGKLKRVQYPTVVDADGNPQSCEVSYDTNARGQLLSILSPEGAVTDLRYFSSGPAEGFLEQSSEGVGGDTLVTTFNYDAAGFPTTITKPGNRTSRFRFNASGQVEQIEQPDVDGQTGQIDYWYDDSGLLIQSEQPAGSAENYDAPGSRITNLYQRDELGHLRQIISNALGTHPSKANQTIDYYGRPISQWNSLGVRTDNKYGEDGCLLWTTVASGEDFAQTDHYVYDRCGRIVRQSNWVGEVTSYEYDLWGRLIQTTHPNGGRQIFVLEDNGRIIEERFEEGKTTLRKTQMDYDARNRIIARIESCFDEASPTPVLLKTKYFYDRDDKLIRTQSPRGAVWIQEFDKMGRPKKMTDSLGSERNYKYNSAGDLTEIDTTDNEPGLLQTITAKNTFDARGRLMEAEVFGSSKRYRYDDRGQIVAFCEPGGLWTELGWNSGGELVEEKVDPGGLALTTKWEYNSEQFLVSHIDAANQSTTFARDVLGRPTAFVLPDGSEWKTIFDRLSRNIQQIRPAGNSRSVSFLPGFDKPAVMTSTAAVGQDPVDEHVFSYDALGRLQEASANGHPIKRKYDSLGRMTEEIVQGKVVRLMYDDLAGNCSLVFPDGRCERTEFNLTGQAIKTFLVTPGVLGGTPGDLLVEIAYTSSGRIKQVRYGNGIEGAYSYDEQGRILSLDYSKEGLLLDSRRLLYDASGHCTVAQTNGLPHRNDIFLLDAGRRLVEVRSDLSLPPLPTLTSSLAQSTEINQLLVSSASSPTISYDLDPADTRNRVSSLIGTPSNELYVSTADHRVVSINGQTIIYNKNGQRTLDSRYQFDLDALDRVIRIWNRSAGTLIVSYEYDALSRVSGGLHFSSPFQRWYLDKRLVEELSGNLLTKQRQFSPHLLGNTILRVADMTGSSFVHYDEGGSSLLLSSTSGAVQERHRYDEFGVFQGFEADGATMLSSFITDPVWRGMPAITGTDLFKTMQRLYDPKTGAFLGRDPMMYSDSSSLYVYASHNPVDYADPSGLAKSPTTTGPVQWVEEQTFLIPPEEVRFYVGQNTPPPAPDRSHGWYPLQKLDNYLSQRFGDYWTKGKTAIDSASFGSISTVLNMVEELNPVNIPDHFLAAGSHANRWIWYSQRGQTGKGLWELAQGHLEASSVVGAVETGGVLVKAGGALGMAGLLKAQNLTKGIPATTVPKGYSVAFEVKLNLREVPILVEEEERRKLHRQSAEIAVLKDITAWIASPDPGERKLGRDMSALLGNSLDWQVHHDAYRPGVLQVVLKSQHQSSLYADLFHPYVVRWDTGRRQRVGGFYLWGISY